MNDVHEITIDSLNIVSKIHNGCIDVINDQETHKEAKTLAKLVKKDALQAIEKLNKILDIPKDLLHGDIKLVCQLLRQAHDILSLSSAPPKREWVGIENYQEVKKALRSMGSMAQVNDGKMQFARAIEQILKEKNGY